MARINAATVRHLANAIATYQGGDEFGVILDSAPAALFGGSVDAASHTCAFEQARTPGIAEGHVIGINGKAWRVAGGTEPDETGWLQLQVYPEA